MLNYTMLERLAGDKELSLLSPFKSYKENKVFFIRIFATLIKLQIGPLS
jgi:hypothetical protein